MAKARLAALAGLLALGGCQLAPPAPVPQFTQLPATWQDHGSWQQVTAPAAAPGPWWQALADPVLAGLERQLDDSNPTLAAALARRDAAAGDLTRARSGLFPQLLASASLSDNRQSEGRPLRGGNQPNEYGNQLVGLGLSYEVDLWGRIRNSVAAGRAELAASEADVAAARLSLETRLAVTYVGLRALDQQIAVLERAVSLFSDAQTLVGHRLAGGIASGIDKARADALLANAEAQLAIVRSDRALAEHAIAALIGVPAPAFSLAPAPLQIDVPVAPAVLPAELLRRRPDIAAAEARVIAANQRVGVARGAFFPQLLLGGGVGVQNVALAGLFSASNLFWAVGPALATSIFDGGNRRGRLKVARAELALAAANYRGAALAGFQQVEDDLSLARGLGDAATAQTAAARAAEAAAALAFERYRGGAVSYLEVVTAQENALDASRSRIATDARLLTARIDLVRATGGGWQG